MKLPDGYSYVADCAASAARQRNSTRHQWMPDVERVDHKTNQKRRLNTVKAWATDDDELPPGCRPQPKPDEEPPAWCVAGFWAIMILTVVSLRHMTDEKVGESPPAWAGRTVYLHNGKSSWVNDFSSMTSPPTILRDYYENAQFVTCGDGNPIAAVGVKHGRATSYCYPGGGTSPVPHFEFIALVAEESIIVTHRRLAGGSVFVFRCMEPVYIGVTVCDDDVDRICNLIEKCRDDTDEDMAKQFAE